MLSILARAILWSLGNVAVSFHQMSLIRISICSCLQILVEEDVQYVLDNLTKLQLNASDLFDPLWFPEYEYEYSRLVCNSTVSLVSLLFQKSSSAPMLNLYSLSISVREGERYAGPALAVLGAIVFLLSLSLCMWLKISGKIIVLQSDERIVSMQESRYSLTPFSPPRIQRPLSLSNLLMLRY